MSIFGVIVAVFGVWLEYVFSEQFSNTYVHIYSDILLEHR